jgi:hypothetical protein
VIKVLKQNNLDVSVFIENTEKPSKIVAILMGMFIKGYTTNRYSLVPNYRYNETENSHRDGVKLSFTKAKNVNNYIHTRLQFELLDQKFNNSIILSAYRYGQSISISTLVELPSIIAEKCKNNEFLNLCSKQSRYMQCQLDGVQILHESKYALSKLKEEDNIKSINVLINRLQDFEDNYRFMYPMLSMKTNTNGRVGISSSEFNRFSKYIPSIKTLSIPSKEAKQKLIDLCDIFRKNNIVNRIGVNNFVFNKVRNMLEVSFCGMVMLREIYFKKFLYLDHPAFNFCAVMIDRGNIFDGIESKITSEIIANM